MRFIFHKDKENNLPHCFNRHEITPNEVKKAFPNYVSQYRDESAFVRLCRADNGKLMEIVWDWKKRNEIVFVITAYYP